MRTKRPALPIEGNDTSGAIRAAFTTMPAADQDELFACLRPAPVPNLDEQIAAAPVEVLDHVALRARSFRSDQGRHSWQPQKPMQREPSATYTNTHDKRRFRAIVKG
jgi:hypothetical protein